MHAIKTWMKNYPNPFLALSIPTLKNKATIRETKLLLARSGFLSSFPLHCKTGYGERGADERQRSSHLVLFSSSSSLFLFFLPPDLHHHHTMVAECRNQQ
jgi:hypothetical protein